ncbi:MAG TPA: hypothetical protein VLI67_05415 [Vicinamibacteria bacterium]|nr:hypothetical protein [Vicinamibacteria bacterium]
MTGRTFLHPAFDYLVIGGGLSLVVTLVLLLPAHQPLQHALAPAMPLLLFLVNLSHFASSTVRLYTKPRAFEEHAFLTMALPLLTLAVLVVAIAFAERLGSHLMNLYLTWSPYHYAAQAYGLAVMYCYRSGVQIDDRDRRLFRAACLAPFLYAFLKGPGVGIEWLLPWQVLGEPHVDAARQVLKAAMAAAAALLPPALYLRARARGRPLPLISLLVIVSNAVWWLVLLYVDAFAWATVFHGLQYLAIVTIFHVQERLRLPGNARRAGHHAAIFLLASVALAYLLFHAWPYAFVLAGFGPVESVMLVVATVNIHHFVVDAYIWRLRRDVNYRTVTAGAGRPLAQGEAVGAL